MNEKRTRFVNEFCVDFNGEKAAIRAGYSEKSAGSIAYCLLKSAEVIEAIEERKSDIAAAAGISTEWVLAQWKSIATADTNDLVQVRKVCCRYCHGIGNGYQWTHAEYDEKSAKCINAGYPVPESDGGFGYNQNKPINENCPECFGNGEEIVFTKDTRLLSGKSKNLYSGVKKTKDGIQIITRDKDAALLNIAKYLSMFVERKEISGPNGGALNFNMLASDLSDDDLAKIIYKNESD